ncbi:unnamed protein product, partial [Aureobasidium uvarum]
MKSSTFFTLASLAALAAAKINVTYTPADGQNVHSGEEVRVLWDQDKLMDLSLQLVKKQEDTNHWPLGFSWVRGDWIKLRLGPGHAEEYTFFVEGFDVNERYGLKIVDNGTSEWFSITKWTPPKHADLK